MKKIVFLSLFIWLCVASNAQSLYDTIAVVKHTSIKDQQMSGTCWAFATISFIESELIRQGKGKHDLSEMFMVYHAWFNKVEMHLRMQGENYLTFGGQMHDVMKVVTQMGLMPESAYGGYTMGPGHDHSLLDTAMIHYVKSIAKLTGPDFAENYHAVVDSILTSHLDHPPGMFQYKGKQHSIESFTSEYYINPEDYITITSYTHRPYFEYFVLEDRFNWDAGLYYNLPFDVFMQVVDDALKNGYSLAWDGDISESGFSEAKGTAKLDLPENSDWVKLRQQMYDTHETKVDHVMHVVGKLKKYTGDEYYLIKNSWGEIGKYDGYPYEYTVSYAENRGIDGA